MTIHSSSLLETERPCFVVDPAGSTPPLSSSVQVPPVRLDFLPFFLHSEARRRGFWLLGGDPPYLCSAFYACSPLNDSVHRAFPPLPYPHPPRSQFFFGKWSPLQIPPRPSSGPPISLQDSRLCALAGPRALSAQALTAFPFEGRIPGFLPVSARAL